MLTNGTPRAARSSCARTALVLAPLTLALSVSGTALGTPNGIEETIEDTSPAFYWTLGDTHLSAVPRASSDPIPLTMTEIDGANRLKGLDAMLEVDYLPMLPEHSTSVTASPASVFGELSGVLNGSRRHAHAGSAEFGDEPLDALAMSGRHSWTFYALVSPVDPDGALCTTGQPVLVIGDEDDGVRLTVDPFDHSPFGLSHTSTYTATRSAGGVDTTVSVTVNHSAVHARDWHEVFLTYSVPTLGVPTLTLSVNGQTDSANDNGIVASNVDEPMILGADDETAPTCGFVGAMHHVAFWKSALSSGDRASISDSRDDPAPTRDPVFADWSDPLHLFVWTVPTRSSDLPAGKRDLRRWKDPLWDRTGFYPMVRFFANDLTHLWAPVTAPGASPQPDSSPESLANSTWEWIQYIETQLQTHTSPQKSLIDGPGYSLFWQNWGREVPGDSPATYYADNGNSRGLLYNWRDSQPGWRLDTGVRMNNEEIEIYNPFYREGVSQNAFRTHETMYHLGEIFDGLTYPPPSRLHYDTEGYGGYDKALPSTSSIHNGWWHDASTDPRTDDVEHWSSASRQLSTVPAPGNAAQGEYTAANSAFLSALRPLMRDEYEVALDLALLRPAREMLNADVLTSDYNMVNSADQTLEHLDYSSPVLYPLSLYSVQNRTNPSLVTLNNWDAALGLSGLGISIESGTSPGDAYTATFAELREDFDNIFVEYSKQKVLDLYLYNFDGTECSTRPIVPWTPYVGFQRAMVYGDNDTPIFQNLTSYATEWEEVARVMIFAYRYGVREIIFWGDDFYLGIKNDGSNDPTPNVEDVERLLDALEYAQLTFADVTTTGATDRTDDAFGIPDGVVDGDDLFYYYERYGFDDPEADLTGPCGVPDGEITPADGNRYYNEYVKHTIE